MLVHPAREGCVSVWSTNNTVNQPGGRKRHCRVAVNYFALSEEVSLRRFR
ncbi:MAG: hypothetical protein ACFFBS_04365 [Promethearchaeota archaeon]